ncbi:MAG: hypothetical protein WBP43_16220 [Chitinophagales bacterium]
MKTNLRLFTFVVMGMLVATSAFAQKASDFKNSKAIIDKAIEYHDDEKYEKAIALYDLINRNDSLYITALSEKSLSLLANENYEEAAAVARLAIASTDKLYPELFVNLGNALDELELREESVAAYDQGIKLFPKNVQLIFNQGVTYYNMKKYPEAVQRFKDVLEINPSHPGTHLMLASLTAMEGKTVQSLLSLCTFLILEPNTNRSKSALDLLVSVATDPSSQLDKHDIKFGDGDDFSEVELLLSNKVSANKKYKVPGDFGNYDFMKQIHLMLNKVEYDASDKGFWMEFYVPYFKMLMEANKFEDFSYYILISADNQNVQKILGKHVSDLKSFDTWWPDTYYNQHKMHNYVLNGKKTKVTFLYSEYNTLSIVGNIEKVGKEDKLVGDFEVYNIAGNIYTTGTFNRSGEKNGLSKFYDEFGNLTEAIEFTNDLYNGKYTKYYTNGQVSLEGNYTEGKAYGLFKEYYYYGGIYVEKNYEDDMLEGTFTMYYPNGLKSVVAEYKKNELDGKVTRYYANGQISEVTEFKAGKAEGKHEEFYADGKLSFTETLVNDESEGPFVAYHSNGNIQAEGVAKKTSFVGTHKTYYRNGKLESEESYDETGKKNGISKNYAPDGVLHYTWEYTKGEITAYTYYDKSGKVISEGKRKLTKFPFVGMDEDGIKDFEGDYVGSSQNGVWKYYNEYGNISTEQTFKDGLLDGKQTEFFEDGSISSTVTWKDDDRDGELKIFNENGLLTETGVYVKGERQGEWLGYHDNGEIKFKLYYMDNLQHGWQEYYDVKGNKESEYYMLEGIILRSYDYDSTGAVVDSTIIDKEKVDLKVLNYNGTVYMNGGYMNGERNGKHTWYGPGGVVETEGDLVNGERHGMWKWYYPNGKVHIEEPYVLGSNEGVKFIYTEDGKIESKREYAADEENGAYILYYDNGKLELEGEYINGIRYGEFKYYDNTGELQLIKNYINDKVVSYTYNGTNGKLVPVITIEGGNANIVAYYTNGKKSVEYTLVKGWYQGTYKEYFSSGKLMEEANYKNDKLEGVRKMYYANGKLESEGTYVNDQLEGVFTKYFENGQVSEVAHYIAGDLYGEKKIYDKTGKLLKTIIYYNDKIVSEK